MKRLFFIVPLFLAAKCMMAEGLSVDPVVLPQRLQTELTIRYQFDKADVYSGYQFALMLPEGVSMVSYTAGDCHQASHLISHNYVSETNENIFAVLSLKSEPLIGTEGVLLKVTIESDGSAKVGETLKGSIQDIVFGTTETVAVPFDNVAFGIEIGEPVIVLDETSATMPAASDGEVPIRVKRTIKAGEWNTICLPFSMTEEQVYEAFGEDVQLMEFIKYEADDDLTSINVIFDDAYLDEDGFFANYPYIIKTFKDITEFTVTSVLEPDEESAYAEFTNGKTGIRKEVYGTFYGTLKSGAIIPENNLFLSANKFYYSSGKTPIMGFRGYFEFVDILSSMENAATAITLRLGKESTNIQQITKGIGGRVYDLQGRVVENPSKGIYINNNKKIIIK